MGGRLVRADPARFEGDDEIAAAADSVAERRRFLPGIRGGLSAAPLLLYNEERGIIPSSTFGMTNVLTKPLNQQTLLGTISAFNQSGTPGPIVIIDDDPQTCDFYHALISRAFPDFPVLIAPNGVVALTILAREKPSLVLLDLMLPDIDGFDVLAQLRLDPQTRQVPVLIISGCFPWMISAG